MIRRVHHHHLTLAIALLLCFAAVGCKVQSKQPETGKKIDRSASIDIGDKLCLPGADLSKAELNLIVAIDNSCPACSQSGKLLKAFTVRATQNKTPVFVVQPSNGTQANQLPFGLTGTPVIARGRATGIKRVPSVLLVDRQGVVTHLWTGSVKTGKEEETVTNFFEGKDGVRQPLVSIDLPELDELKRQGRSFQLVDITNPQRNSASTVAKLPGELSIPGRDLGVRGPRELDRKRLVILDCRIGEGFDCQNMLMTLQSQGFTQSEGLMLGRLGQSPACEANQGATEPTSK